jgi:hypothetical protein
VHEGIDHGAAGVPIQTPQTSCLRRRQPKARHFYELGTDPAQDNF